MFAITFVKHKCTHHVFVSCN